MRISDWKSGRVYVEVPARTGSRLSFRWMHSLEKFPWNEHYNVDEDRKLVLDEISFPAFGAGVPENRGKTCRIENGLIRMGEIEQAFAELIWLNSHYATRCILLDGALVARGADLPDHVRLRLAVEKGNGDETYRK